MGFCETVYRCLLDCLSGGQSVEKAKVKPRKGRGSLLDVVGAGINDYFVDKVEIGIKEEDL